jgi:hypothetical protein
MPVWRTIRTRTEHDNPGHGKHWAVGGSRTLALSCGHELVRKQSQTIPARVRCKRCESILAGEDRRSSYDDGITWTKEVWDRETGMPMTVPCDPQPDLGGAEHG